ncbi:MAG: M3 family oligoendopeptidase [Actinomycetota bacterium]|nr:M3 family oligoendopeptidase [Actinomycetota bacterium]
MSHARAAVPRWDLEPLGPPLGSPAFAAREEEVESSLTRLAALFDEHQVRGGEPLAPTTEVAAVVGAVVEAVNSVIAEVRALRAHGHALVAQDATDDEAAGTQDRLRTQLTAPLNTLMTRFDAWASRFDARGLAEHEPVVADHLYALQRSAEAAAHQMSEDEERLAAELGLTGGAAWVRLHGDLTARLTGHITHGPDTGAELPMTVLRAAATDPDPARRDAAFEAEVAAWEGASIPLAAALNSQKGETAALNRRRGWSDDLEPALFENGIDRPTLDAMTAEVVDALPAFRRFLATKAGLLGVGPKMPWSGLVAPVMRDASQLEWAQAVDRVRSAFGSYGDSLDRLARRAVNEEWIDAEPRPGKASGAFCMPVRDDVSRILMTFDGSADATQTLAHELGHAYHNMVLGSRTWLQRQTPRCLAETASIFCETLVVEELLASPDTDRLSVLDTDLSGAAQVVVDIHSRYLFETELYRRRADGTLSVTELCELMTACQSEAYGDVVEPLHPYMWAVKAHYFTPYYNFPYTFGLLFGLGLYARYREDPQAFRVGYDDLLGATGLASAVDLGARFDLDITDRSFWRASLDVLRRRIDEYCDLAAD